MNKNFRNYALIWLILLIVFNIICFVIPNDVAGINKFEGTFWTGYVFISLAFISNLVCAYFAFKAENLQKLFYNLPLITISYTGLILMLIFGALSMAIPKVPTWVGIIVSLIILSFNIIAVVNAKWVGDIVSSVDESIKVQTQFIKMLTLDAQGLINRAKSDAIKVECKKVHEIIRYSDPMSSDALSVLEAKITVKLDEFKSAVEADQAKQAKDIADELVILAKDRNAMCKVLK